ncbi:Global transcription regulator sge1 [Dipsacomyces acuminosporus]|nr:Global transcription regulator sge1 [Dipsacomyces acuminosporus]
MDASQQSLPIQHPPPPSHELVAQTADESYSDNLSPPKEAVIGGYGSCVTVSGIKVYSTRDALTVFEACRQGILPRVQRRLTEQEKQQIDDGTIVVFDEKEAKMKRWTDGKLWTPSRILGNFLVYRELERKLQPNASQSTKEIEQLSSKRAFGSNKGVFFLKQYGLMKRTISLTVPENEEDYLKQQEWRPPNRMHQQHLIAYFRAETLQLLPSPDDIEELVGLRLPLPLLRIQRFRRPLKVFIGGDFQYDIQESDDEDSVDASGAAADTDAASAQVYHQPLPPADSQCWFSVDPAVSSQIHAVPLAQTQPSPSSSSSVFPNALPSSPFNGEQLQQARSAGIIAGTPRMSPIDYSSNSNLPSIASSSMGNASPGSYMGYPSSSMFSHHIQKCEPLALVHPQQTTINDVPSPPNAAVKPSSPIFEFHMM